MTERKGLKKIVRGRMDRTGESYTTAHRHTTARRQPLARDTQPAPREPLPAGLIPGYASFGRRSHHESSLVRHLLAQVGIELTEPMVCGLGGGIGFLYAVFEYAAADHPLLTIVGQHHPQPWPNAVLDRLDVPYREQHSSSAAAAVGKLHRALDRGRAVLCTVDRSGLPWHGDVPPVAAADPYLVVVVGADGDTLLVDDLERTPHRLATDEFATAWSGHRKGRHHMLTLGQPPAALDLPAAVIDAIRTTASHLTGPVLGNSFDANFGLSGMDKLARQLGDRRSRAGWARRFATPAGFDHAMRRLDVCL